MCDYAPPQRLITLAAPLYVWPVCCLPPGGAAVPRMRDHDEALKPYHDVLIIGTGLVESILAAALTKVGKTVLHFEKHEYYGNDEWSTFDLPSILKWAEGHRGSLPDNTWSGPPSTILTPDVLRRQWPKELWGGALLGRQEGGTQGQDEKEEAGGEVASQDDKEEKKSEEELPPLDLSVPEQCLAMPTLPASFSSVRVLAIHGGNTTAQEQEQGGAGSSSAATINPDGVDKEDGSRADGDVLPSAPVAAVSLSASPGEEGASQPPAPPPPPARSAGSILLEERGRAFMLDVTPTVLLAAGETVECLCSSGVANYMEFKAFQGLYLAGSSSLAQPTSVHKVPCSKADVFTSKLLSAKDKRQLMKMMQFVTDWGFKRTGKAPVNRNEVELGQGRSLHRPQNKGVVNLDADAFADRPFRDFLDHAKLDAHAQWVVTYALALVDEDQEGGAQGGSGSLTTEQGLMQLFRHLNGLGRYGDTAFLWPVYGANDFIHAFCRTAAVWGATYVLRESITQLLLDPTSGRCLGVMDETGAALSCEAVIMGQDFLPNCRHTGRSVIKRISVLDGPLVGEGGEKRVGGLLPPRSIKGNRHSIYFYQLDAETMVVPQGAVLLYLVATLEDDEDRDITDHALQALLSQQQQQQQPPPEELWGITIEAHMLDPPSHLTNDGQQSPSSTLPPNLFFVPRTRPEFYLQSPLDQARDIFQRICPDEAFLPAEVPQELAQYIPNLGNEDEDENILESISKQLLDTKGIDSVGSGGMQEDSGSA